MAPKIFKAKRSVRLGEYKFTQIFIGPENSPTLLRLFGSQRSMSKIVRHLKVSIIDSDWGIWLDHNWRRLRGSQGPRVGQDKLPLPGRDTRSRPRQAVPRREGPLRPDF